MRAQTFIAMLLGLLAGFGGVRVLRARHPSGAAAAVLLAHAPSKMRCVDLSTPAEPDECPELHDAVSDCDRQLEDALAVHPTTRLPFPDDVPEGLQPDVWTDTLAQALQTCGVPGTLEATDCAEYPCTAALRIDPQDQARAEEIWKSCPALQAMHASFASFDVHCPDGSVESAQVVLPDDADDLYASSAEQAAAPDAILTQVLTEGRRVESVLQLWDCNVDAP